VKITIGSPEVLIICGTALGIFGSTTGLIALVSIGCVSGVFRFASEYQDREVS
tara:strand:+ start:470 stop:628 length:159 start_codon:yes stop_codon:yes gene_type:complete